MHFFIYHKKEQASIPVPLSSDIAKNFSIIWINLCEFALDWTGVVHILPRLCKIHK